MHLEIIHLEQSNYNGISCTVLVSTHMERSWGTCVHPLVQQLCTHESIDPNPQCGKQ